jgi:hypothetical protein
MKLRTNLVAIGVVVALGAGQQVVAAQKKEEDSVYQWGRWAVLSPAAGGPPPYVAALAPDAVNNARPEEADEFSPKVLLGEVEPPEPPEPPIEPPAEVVESCTAGAACSFATYSRQEGDGPTNGPVLASFDLTTKQVSEPGGDEVGPGPSITVTNFAVTGSGDAAFPDINSVDMEGEFVDGGPDLTGTLGDAYFDSELGAVITDSETSTLSHSNQDTGQVYDFDGVDAGYWQQLAQQQIDYILGDNAGASDVNAISDSGGYFVGGLVATVEQMEAFAAGRVSATYDGFVLDYASPVQLNFNFDNNTFNGNFGTANGFTGFEIDGAVKGVNFSAADAGKEVVGSFFNGGLNASGAVNNGAQRGVFSTDLAGSTVEASR